MFKIAWTTWTESFKHDVNAEEVMSVVEGIRAADPEPPVMVEISQTDCPGRAFTVGLGRADTVVTYQESVDPHISSVRGSRCRMS